MGLLGKKISEMTPEEVELLKEAAQALLRSSERLEKALKRLSDAEDYLEEIINIYNSLFSNRKESGHSLHEESSFQAALKEAIIQYNNAWKKAEKARYIYIVQREAIGFRNHKFVDKVYPLPPLKKVKVPFENE